MSISLEHVAARLAALEDKEAIRALKATYLRACDLKQPEVVRECFAPGVIRIAYQNFPVFTDRDAFVAVFRDMGCQPGVFDIHHATNWDIVLTGEDTATGKWSLNFRTILAGPRQVVRLAVEYEDIYRKQDGRWWIVDTVSIITSMLTEEIADDGSCKVIAFGAPPTA
ncbi:MAG: nuclear transport factor 2 family protein [Sphingomonadales bacterium]|nr:nuclear transport factor 2 family protein [Sphingomonadales bacterium]